MNLVRVLSMTQKKGSHCSCPSLRKLGQREGRQQLRPLDRLERVSLFIQTLVFSEQYQSRVLSMDMFEDCVYDARWHPAHTAVFRFSRR